MDGVAAPVGGLAVLRREAPLHALMIVVMVVAMLVGTTPAMLVGSGAMVVAAVGCAALSRRAGHFAVQCVDLWAMALGMVALASHPAPGHHAVAVPGLLLYLAVGAGWAVARIVLARRRDVPRGSSIASAALTVAGLAVMLVLH